MKFKFFITANLLKSEFVSCFIEERVGYIQISDFNKINLQSIKQE